MGSKTAPYPGPDGKWGDMIAGYSADELVAARLVAPEHWDLARRIISQQIYISLLSSRYPVADSHPEPGVVPEPPDPLPVSRSPNSRRGRPWPR